MNKESVSMRTDKDAAADVSKRAPTPRPQRQSSSRNAPAAARRNRYARGERLRKLETWVPRLAVALVAVSALAAVVYSGGYDPRDFLAALTPEPEQAEQAEQTRAAQQTAQPAQAAQTQPVQTQPVQTQPVQTPAAQTQAAQAEAGAATPEAVGAGSDAEKEPVLAVVTAPPLKPPGRTMAAGSTSDTPGRSPDTRALGSDSACAKCGVVETVVAVHGYAQPQASGYQMHIRMDDGSVRTVEQRGALAAGSRVIVERGSVRALPDPPGQG
jgi:hypothetical protein